jgi:hypothetical protein
VSSDALQEDYFEAARKLNPNLLTATGLHRGYMRLDLSKKKLQCDLVALETAKTPGAKQRTLISYVVEPGNPAPVAL